MAVPVNVSVKPEHTGFGVADAVTPVGAVFTTSEPVFAVEDPQPGADAVIVYIPASPDTAEVIPAVNDVELVISLNGPVQAYVFPKPPVDVAAKVSVLLTHAGFGLTVAVNVVGNSLIFSVNE